MKFSFLIKISPGSLPKPGIFPVKDKIAPRKTKIPPIIIRLRAKSFSIDSLISIPSPNQQTGSHENIFAFCVIGGVLFNDEAIFLVNKKIASPKKQARNDTKGASDPVCKIVGLPVFLEQTADREGSGGGITWS